jgi:Plasmid pRiA4b ORF-3-like protein
MASRRPATPPRAVARRVAAITRVQVQLKVELRGVKPLVWRRILVPETVTLAKLHAILLRTMGWDGGHLHEYEIAHQRYGVPDPEWPQSEPILDERRVRLKPLLETGLRRFTYTYDFGDGWEHVIKVEEIVPPKPAVPPIVCIAGANACPPEDVGGEPGYENFLTALADPSHEEHADMKRWIGRPFNPTAFDLAEVNERLAGIKP